MKVNQSHRHHFVPECYLKQFIEKTHLFVLDITKVKKGYDFKLMHKHPAGICYLEDYYKIENKSIHDQFNLSRYEKLFIEKNILRSLEGKYEMLVRKIIETKNLNLKESEAISDFIIMMKLRNPYWLKETIDKYKTEWLESSVKNIMDNSISSIFKNISAEDRNTFTKTIVEINKNDRDFSKKLQLYSLIQRYEKENKNQIFREAIINSEWFLLQSPKYGPYFITSDNPGYSLNQKNNLIYNSRFVDDFAFYFPLSNQYCLLILGMLKDHSYLMKKGKQIFLKKVNGLEVLTINDKTIQMINKLVIGSDELYLSKIAALNKPTN